MSGMGSIRLPTFSSSSSGSKRVGKGKGGEEGFYVTIELEQHETG